ncbi:NAD(+) synthase [Gleimia hominis]|uniref:NAD(+) synthase n=1 Tax=Gleimia hominis TaxID=595468 RepID=UPI000C804AF0|nr:NAD(+) synthase [Gleimia hominis]WIK64667.1 NAD(+) synthase [Gleimia hominis]
MGSTRIAQFGFIRTCALSIPIALADPVENARRIAHAAANARQQGADIILTPQLSLTGASCADLFTQAHLLEATNHAVVELLHATADNPALLVVGAPVVGESSTRVFNGALAMQSGEVKAVFAQANPSDLEARWFAPASAGLQSQWGPVIQQLRVNLGHDTPLPGAAVDAFTLGVSVGDDFESTPGLAPTVLLHMAAAPAQVGRIRTVERDAAALARRRNCAVVYANAGFGESANDAAWSGHTFVIDHADTVKRGATYAQETAGVCGDIDVHALAIERRTGANTPLKTAQQAEEALSLESEHQTKERAPLGTESIALSPVATSLLDPIARFPYTPADTDGSGADLREIYELQAAALVARMRAIGDPKPVIGISGGLDSTQALLVIARAMDLMGRSREEILTFTLPGFATTDHTKNNARDLCVALGTTFEELDIRPTATQMLQAMGHPFGRGEEVYDVTFENVQAGLRTDFLFRIANARGGLVIGTGDLSELALGWCTFGVGDHMSAYSVNGGLPKTLMQHLIRYTIRASMFGTEVNQTLQSILDTEITPELIPTKPGAKAQSTQGSIGPYALHDFTLYYTLRYGFSPRKVAFLARHAWEDVERGSWPEGTPERDRTAYSKEQILQWMRVFYRRFINNQFKRSTLPNGPSALAFGSVSPRGGWLMPSDARAHAWVAEMDALIAEQTTGRRPA